MPEEGPKYLVFPHLGLGDQLIMNGFIHFLRETQKPSPAKIVILAKEPHTATLADMYNGYSNLGVLTVKGDEEVFGSGRATFQAAVQKYLERGFQIIPFGVFSGNNEYLKLDPCWANCFYKQVGLPPQVRFDFFRLPLDLSKSEAAYRALVNRIGENYIVVHDDPSRKLEIDYSHVRDWLIKNGLQNLPVVYLGENRYSHPLIPFTQNPPCSDILTGISIFDTTHILRNAAAALMMDSCLAILLDLSKPTRHDQRRVSYIRHSAFPTKGVYQLPWEFVA
jgi:hypothetical protein